MKIESNFLQNRTNVLRFYIDNNDKISMCDYIENSNGMIHEEIKLNQDELKKLFKKYIDNDGIFHEEKIYDRFILFKFYNVDINEIYSLIKKSRENEKRNFNKFKSHKMRNQDNRRKIIRKNKFNNNKVIATIETVGFLLTSSIIIINIATNNSDKKNTSNTSKSSISTNNTYDYQESLSYDIESISTKPEKIYDQYIEIYTDDWTEDEKYFNAKDNYYNLILKYSKMYGIDPQVALAIACQERGIHNSEVDAGGGLGLYQIQIEGKFNWENQDVYAYNFETNSNEKYTIHKEQISNLENNIKAGLMIFQECLRRNGYDIAKAIQEYNYGYGNMREVLETCYTDRNPQTEYNKLAWLAYRNVINVGDQNYLENVLKFIKNNTVLEFKNKDGQIITCKYTNLSMNDMMKK